MKTICAHDLEDGGGTVHSSSGPFNPHKGVTNQPLVKFRSQPIAADRAAPKSSQTAQQAMSHNVAKAEPSGQRPPEIVVRSAGVF